MKRDCACPRVRHQHGTYMAYDHDRCRCLPCAIAYSEWKRCWRAGDTDRERATVDGTGTRRRLQALTVLGWSPPQLAPMLGMNEQAIMKLRNSGPQRRVLPATADAVTTVYDRLWDTRSRGPHATRMTNLALRRGWLPPLAWDDDTIDDPAAEPFRATYIPAADRGVDWIAVEEACLGRRVPLTSEERAAAVERLTRAGKSAKQAAAILGASGRTVVRRRHQNQRKDAA